MSGYPDDPSDRDRDAYDRDRDDYERQDRDYDDRDPEAIIAQAKSKVSGPAIGLIVVAALGLLSVIGGVIQYATLDAQFDAQIKQMEAQPNVPADQKKEQVRLMNQIRDWCKVGLLPYYGLVGVLSVVALVGGIKMMNLTSSGWAYMSAVLSLVPCTSGCCFLGLIFGIWAIMVLGKPEVKAGFAARRSSNNRDSY